MFSGADETEVVKLKVDYVLDPKTVNGTYLDYKVAQYDPEK